MLFRSTVTMRRRGRVAFSTTLRVGRGSHYVTIVPQKRGPLEVDVRAVDLAGNAASADGTLRVRPAPKRRG